MSMYMNAFLSSKSSHFYESLSHGNIRRPLSWPSKCIRYRVYLNVHGRVCVGLSGRSASLPSPRGKCFFRVQSKNSHTLNTWLSSPWWCLHAFFAISKRSNLATSFTSHSFLEFYIVLAALFSAETCTDCPLRIRRIGSSKTFRCFRWRSCKQQFANWLQNRCNSYVAWQHDPVPWPRYHLL